MHSKVLTKLLLVIFVYVPNGIYAQDSSAISTPSIAFSQHPDSTTHRSEDREYVIAVTAGLSNQKGLYGGLYIPSYTGIFGEAIFGYNFFSSNKYVIGVEFGLTPDDIMINPGIYYSAIMTSNSVNFSGRDAMQIITINCGWLTYNGSLFYDVALGVGAKFQHDSQQGYHSPYPFLNIGVRIGYSFLTF